LDAPEPYEIRDPIHGFVRLSQLEWDVVNQPVFQRLRKIRQLAWTDLVYPGAMHTRFEHSLGVMHVSSRLFDTLARRDSQILLSEYKFDSDSLGRQRRIIRLAALLHDLGHGPFSHAGEGLLPMKADKSRRLEHEDYSAAALEFGLKDVIENHPEAKNHGIGIRDVLSVFGASPATAGVLVWKDLVSGQMDADRMDYLLRDAYHAGVQYGRYDLDRVVHTIRLCPDPETRGHHIGVDEDGIHAVEGLLIARFMMFTQLYFHKTRTIYDFHLAECMRHLLAKNGGEFPPTRSISKFLKWDDWKVLGRIAEGAGGEHGEIIRTRQHYRPVFMTPEVASDDDLLRATELEERLKALGCIARDAEKSWYKSGPDEIKVWRTSGGTAKSVPLATLSPVVNGLTKVNQRRLYVPISERKAANEIVQKNEEKKK
jgi:uncharacterized protein